MIEKKARIGKAAVSINQARDDALQKRPQFADLADESMRAETFRSRHQDAMATTRARERPTTEPPHRRQAGVPRERGRCPPAFCD